MKLEDTILDILGKAQKAQGITDRDLCKTANIGVPELNSIRSGRREPAALERISRALGLRPDPIAEMANETWQPPTVALPTGVMMFTTPFADLTVNHYLIWDPATAASVLVGTLAGLLYLRLLARSVSRLGVDSKSVGKVQLLVPITLVLAAARIPQLQMLPALLGFLLYKPALILQAVLDG